MVMIYEINIFMVPNPKMRLDDYYLLLMIHCFIALKIYDELANRKSIYTKS